MSFESSPEWTEVYCTKCGRSFWHDKRERNRPVCLCEVLEEQARNRAAYARGIAAKGEANCPHCGIKMRTYDDEFDWWCPICQLVATLHGPEAMHD
jgi:hypothetical protein